METTHAETTLKVKPIYGISLDANYTFTYTEQTSGAQKGEPLSNVPRHSFTIKPMYQIGNFSTYIRWQGRFQTPTLLSTGRGANVRTVLGKYYKDYQLVDIAVNYKVTPNATLTFAVNNLFNVNFADYIIYNNTGGYENQYQRILPSRSYWVSLRAEF